MADGGTVVRAAPVPGGTSPTKTIVTPGDVTAAAGPGVAGRANNDRGGYSGGRDREMGFLGSDGQVYSGPDEATAQVCSGCEVMNTTFQRDAKVEAERVAAQAARDAQVARDREFADAEKATRERESSSRDSSGSHGNGSTRDSGSQTDRASGS